MIVVDTSVWIDHLRKTDARLGDAMKLKQALMHPFVIDEITLGSIARRRTIIAMLKGQYPAPVALHDEVLDMIEREHRPG